MQVYVLTVEINGPSLFWGEYTPTGEYAGQTSVHITPGKAMAALNKWLDEHGIDQDTAYAGSTTTGDRRFMGNDIDPDLLDGNVLSWGINRYEVEM
jgi:hypothetical protein